MMRLSLGFESSGSAIAATGGNRGEGRIKFERNSYSLGGGWRRKQQGGLGVSPPRNRSRACLLFIIFSYFARLSAMRTALGLSGCQGPPHPFTSTIWTQYTGHHRSPTFPFVPLSACGRCSLFLRQFSLTNTAHPNERRGWFFTTQTRPKMTPVAGRSVVAFYYDVLVLRCVDHVLQLS